MSEQRRAGAKALVGVGAAIVGVVAIAMFAYERATPTGPAPITTVVPPDPSWNHPASDHVNGDHYVVALYAASDCQAGADCTATVRLEAKGDFHVNADYPYKFTPAKADGVTFAKPTFGRASGDFREDSAKVGNVAVHFTAEKAGNPTITGLYNFSVCAAERCEIEKQTLSLAVPIR